MERRNNHEADKKLMAYWLARKADAQTALDCANRQIAYLSNFIIEKSNEEQVENEDWIIRGYD